jgi:hypothetical protein
MNCSTKNSGRTNTNGDKQQKCLELCWSASLNMRPIADSWTITQSVFSENNIDYLAREGDEVGPTCLRFINCDFDYRYSKTTWNGADLSTSAYSIRSSALAVYPSWVFPAAWTLHATGTIFLSRN